MKGKVTTDNDISITQGNHYSLKERKSVQNTRIQLQSYEDYLLSGESSKDLI